MDLILSLDGAAKKSLQGQIFDEVRTAILDGRLQAGAGLPPTRILADQLSVSRNTVINAYERLASEGYVEARGTAGIFVTSIPPDDLLRITGDDLARQPVNAEPQGIEEPLICFAGSPGGERQNRPKLDMWVGRSASSAFPITVWKRIIGQVLSAGTRHLTDYSDPAGLPELRKAVSEHLTRTRGMNVVADQVIVTAGAQEALNLVLKLLREQTRQLCIEDPCYVGASMLFQKEKLPIHAVPVDHDGIVTDLLPNASRSLLYVTPSHQYPTGVMMSLNRRLALLKWAESTDSYIIEDDYDSDFRYDGPPITALSGIDKGRRVLYVGSFSKSIGPGIRLGFAVVPRAYCEPARLAKAEMSNGQSWLDQKVSSEFILNGHFDRHLRKLRQVYKRRRDRLVSALERHFGACEISGQESGLHFVWKLPAGAPPAKVVERRARAAGLGLYSLSSGAAFDFNGSAADDSLMLGYSSLSEEEIELAVEKLDAILGQRR